MRLTHFRFPVYRYLASHRVARLSACLPTDTSYRPLKLLPASIADVPTLLNPRRNYFFVNKAPFIPHVENAAAVTVLLRPRRWGKTVFLNFLATYYDIAFTDAPLVSGISTPFAHAFTVLKFDLANVARALSSTGASIDVQAQTKSALDAEVRNAVEDVIQRYSIPGIDMTQSPTEMLRKLGRCVSARGAPLFIFVDEYDAVLRTLAITSGSHALSTLAGRQGPLREFFGRFKFLMDSGIASRVFMTGKASSQCY
jgi:hypothetical protein